MTATHSLERADDVVQSLDALRTRLTEQPHVDDTAQDVLRQASQLIEQLRELVSTLDGQLAAMRWLAQKQYRPKSEHVAPGQLALDLLGFLLQPKTPESAASGDVAAADVAAGAKPEPRQKRRSGVRLLPVEQVERRLAEHERLCPCCGGVQAEMGSDPRRHLVFEPARLFFREELLFKYSCRKCSEGVVIAKGTPKLIEGSNVSSSLLAHLVVSKVVDAVPIERVGKQLSRHGADFASSTLNDWYGRCGDEVLFLQPIAHQELLRSQMASLDDTPIPTKSASAPLGIMRGRLWLYLGDVSRIAYCEFSPDWKGVHPQRVLQGFRGPIQTMGTAGCTRCFVRVTRRLASDAMTTRDASLSRRCAAETLASNACWRSTARCMRSSATPSS